MLLIVETEFFNVREVVGPVFIFFSFFLSFDKFRNSFSFLSCNMWIIRIPMDRVFVKIK